MKYRIVYKDRAYGKLFYCQYKNFLGFWCDCREGYDDSSVSRDTVKEADEWITKFIKDKLTNETRPIVINEYDHLGNTVRNITGVNMTPKV